MNPAQWIEEEELLNTGKQANYYFFFCLFLHIYIYIPTKIFHEIVILF